MRLPPQLDDQHVLIVLVPAKNENPTGVLGPGPRCGMMKKAYPSSVSDEDGHSYLQLDLMYEVHTTFQKKSFD
jgi:hypothetical protein